MTEPFIPAAELKARFHCLGFFYQRQLSDGTVLRCRNILEIVTHDMTEAHRVFAHEPDALAVMMNPGSSRPLETTDAGPLVPGTKNIVDRMTLVPTRPDNTQYQLMRVMVEMGWRHVRVLNLSDIREPKSPRLFQTLRSLQSVPHSDCHTIFSPGRAGELNRLKGMSTTPVIAGWGRHPDLEPLARRCRCALADRLLVGVPVPGHPMRYGHPSPHLQTAKLAWLATVHHQLGVRLSGESIT